MIHGLDLFSGIGGMSLGLRELVRPVCYVESDPYCQALLADRIREGHLPAAPIWSDVQTFDGRPWRGVVDCILAGFPCQDISTAGTGAGLEGKRSGLFREVLRIADECEPAFLFLENVPAIRTRGLATVGAELAARGYDCRWTVVSAQEVGAPHLRRRWFCLASHADRIGLRNEPERLPRRRKARLRRSRKTLPLDNGAEGPLAHTESLGSHEGEPQPTWQQGRPGTHLRRFCHAAFSGLEEREGERRNTLEELTAALGTSWWAVEPTVGRVAHGIPYRVDQLRALGNSVVPRQAREAFERLAGASIEELTRRLVDGNAA